MKMLEVCVDSLTSARNAIAGGADRLELCSALIAGGLTPYVELLEQIRTESDIPVRCLMRPRAGDFLYEAGEIDMMAKQMPALKAAGANGFVIGCLTKGGNLDEDAMKKIVGLIRKYDCAAHCYFMISPDSVIRQFKEYAPDIPICVGHDAKRPWEIVDRAIALGAQKVQLFKPWFNREMIEKAHAHGIICNVFWSDDPAEAREFLNMGIDTILTNDYLLVSQILKDKE